MEGSPWKAVEGSVEGSGLNNLLSDGASMFWEPLELMLITAAGLFFLLFLPIWGGCLLLSGGYPRHRAAYWSSRLGRLETLADAARWAQIASKTEGSPIWDKDWIFLPSPISRLGSRAEERVKFLQLGVRDDLAVPLLFEVSRSHQDWRTRAGALVLLARFYWHDEAVRRTLLATAQTLHAAGSRESLVVSVALRACMWEDARSSSTEQSEDAEGS